MFCFDQYYMQQALLLARRGQLTVSPNPMVGCVIVKDGCIVGEGWHQYAGGEHAEIIALRQANTNAKNATLYVTLEPCCHVGKTPACVPAIVQAKIKRVVVATIDPNPLVAGKGIALLTQHGITVDVGICHHAAQQLNQRFFHFHQRKSPYVIAKWGMSADGRWNTHATDTRQITNQQSQQQVHDLRNQCDAIMVGANTVLTDNADLTTRFSTADLIRHPLRVVVTDRVLPLHLKVFDTSVSHTLLLMTNQIDPLYQQQLQVRQVDFEVLPQTETTTGIIKPQIILRTLFHRGISSVLIEGGQTLLSHFFAENLVSEVRAYIAPVIINGVTQKLSIPSVQFESVGNDLLCVGQLASAKGN